MFIQKLDKTKTQNLINKFAKIQRIRQKSLEILIKVDRKAGEYKLSKLKKKLEGMTK